MPVTSSDDRQKPVLRELYGKRLSSICVAGQKTYKILKRLSIAALTEELRHGLSPESFDQQLHAQRLKQCFKLAKLKSVKSHDRYIEVLLEEGEDSRRASRAPSLLRDMELLHSGLKIINANQIAFREVNGLAIALGDQQAASLLDQSDRDCQNAYHYLTQIANNIIYPVARDLPEH